MRKEFSIVQRESDKIMSHVYDPFHDEKHIQEITYTAHTIYEALDSDQKKCADHEIIMLACALHDTSRRNIKTNLILQPFLDGLISGTHAHHILIYAGYDHATAREVKQIISAHESILSYFKKNDRLKINFKIFSDADYLEKYSVSRLERGLVRFERKEFSPLLFNTYMTAIAYKEKYQTPSLHFDISHKILEEYQCNMKKFLIDNKNRMDSLLYPRIAGYFYSMNFLS